MWISLVHLSTCYVEMVRKNSRTLSFSSARCASVSLIAVVTVAVSAGGQQQPPRDCRVRP